MGEAKKLAGKMALRGPVAWMWGRRPSTLLCIPIPPPAV
jgi:hypothetical protein